MKGDPLQHVELELGTLLRVGVTLAAGVVALGGAAFLWRHGGEAVNYHAFRSEPANLRSPIAVGKDVLNGSTRAMIQLGLILLIATPIVRVAFSVGSFARQRDWTYVAFTLIVLALLAYGLIG
jgi:uncharacterized membrane protein